MKYRALGSTGIQVSELSFGAGPVAGLMTDSYALKRQCQTVQRALEAGINWFDTAATYGNGRSESNLGAAFRELRVPATVNVATKVRLASEQLGTIRESVRISVAASLRRLGCARLTLVQLHNAITPNRGDLPTSITPRDVLGGNGVLGAFEDLRSDGLVQYIGLTGLGDGLALLEVVRGGPWATIQICHSILHRRIPGAEDLSSSLAAGAPHNQIPGAESSEASATHAGAASQGDPLLAACAGQRLGVIAIRVLAGGALAGQPPSAHTLTTQFFPLKGYRHDEENAAQLAKRIPPPLTLKEAAIRYVLNEPAISTALIGFASPAQIDEVVRFASAGALPTELLRTLLMAGKVG